MTDRRCRRTPGARPPDDVGSATALVVVLVTVLATVAVVVSLVGGAVVEQRRVEAAADLAALAGAGAVQAGHDPCSAARSVAGRNGAALVGCAVDGDEVTVRAQQDTRAVLGMTFTVTGRARAGPVVRMPGR